MTRDQLEAARARLQSDDVEERRKAIAELPGGLLAGVLELLVAALADDDWRVRKEAVGRMVDWPDRDGAVGALIEVVGNDDDVGRRNAALDAIAHIGAPAVPALLAEVGRGGEHRKFLVDSLGAIGEEAAVPLLVTLVDDDDPNLRVAAAEALRHIGGTEAVRALRRALEADDLPLRLAALEGLAILQAAVPVAEVRPALEDAVLRKAGLLLLGWSCDPAAVPHLVDALRQPRRALHAPAVAALANLLAHAPDSGGAESERAEIRRLTGALAPEARANAGAVFASAGAEQRRAAAAVLSAAGAVDQAEALAAAITDPAVAEACASALSAMGPGVVEPVVRVAEQADPEVAADLFDLLAQLGHGGERVDAVLTAGLDSDDELTAAAAARALGAVGGAGAVEGLAEALQDPDSPDLAAGAAAALGRLGARGLAPAAAALLRARGLGNHHPEVRAAAALALADLADSLASDVVDAVAGQLTDDEPFARLAAIRALAGFGEVGRQHLRRRLAAEDDAEMADAIRAALAEADAG